MRTIATCAKPNTVITVASTTITVRGFDVHPLLTRPAVAVAFVTGWKVGTGLRKEGMGVVDGQLEGCPVGCANGFCDGCSEGWELGCASG